MATQTLDLLPARVDLRLYVGDDVAIQLIFWTDTTKTVRLDVSGYSSWAAQIRDPAGTPVSFTVDDGDAADGVIVLDLEGNDVRGLPRRGNRWDVRCVSPAGKEITPMSGRVIFKQDVVP